MSTPLALDPNAWPSWLPLEAALLFTERRALAECRRLRDEAERLDDMIVRVGEESAAATYLDAAALALLRHRSALGHLRLVCREMRRGRARVDDVEKRRASVVQWRIAWKLEHDTATFAARIVRPALAQAARLGATWRPA